MTNPNRFYDVFFAQKGKQIDKWEQYLGIYEAEIGGLYMAGQPVDLLEIGVQNGGSLEFWAEVLPAGSTFTGLDIDPSIENLKFENSNIRVIRADATDATQVNAALKDATFDIIIDDGSHVCSDLVSSFIILYPRLRSGGAYFLEDLHTSYYPSYGGGFLNPSSSVETLKQMIDLLHVDHCPPDVAQSLVDALPIDIKHSLGSVSFFDSLAVLER